MWHQAYLTKYAVRRAVQEEEGDNSSTLAGLGLIGAGVPTFGLGLAARRATNNGAEMLEAGRLAGLADTARGPVRTAILQEMPVEYLVGGHKLMNNKILGRSTADVLNTLLNKPGRALGIGAHSSPDHYAFVQRHYDSFKHSPRSALDTMIGEAYQFDRAKTPAHAYDMLKDYDALAASKVAPKEALRQLFRSPKYQDVMRRIAVNKLPWAKYYSGMVQGARALPVVGAGLALGGGALLARNALKRDEAKA